MTRSIKYLIETHKKMSTVLSFLDMEISEFKLGKSLDYLLIESILDYMTRSSQLNHHQVEDEIHRLLSLRNPEAVIELSNIPLEHEKIRVLSNALQEALENVEADTELPRMWFVSVVQEYQNAQWRHMHMEEEVLFPLAEQYLKDEDWDAIHSRMIIEAKSEASKIENADVEDLRTDLALWKTDTAFMS